MGRGGDQRIPRPEQIRPGRVPAWLGDLDFALAVTRDSLASGLPEDPSALDMDSPHGARPAAILVPFFDGADGANTILTRRPLTAPSHAGEIAFPGGMAEEYDADLAATAVREACEEIALDPDRVEILARLPLRRTRVSSTAITPFAAWVNDPGELYSRDGEVERILEVPITELLHPDAYRCEEWNVWGQWFPFHFFEIEGETVWGMTASVIATLFDVLHPDATPIPPGAVAD